MKKIIIFIMLLFTLGLYAQPEHQSKQTIIIAPKEDSKWQAPKTSPLLGKDYLNKKENRFLQLPEKEIDFTGKSKYIKRPFKLPDNITDIQKKKDSDVPAAKKNQDFGEFFSNAEYVNFYCRDYSAIDGDMIDIYLNDNLIYNNISLVSEFRGYDLPLKSGFNKIEVVALNQGEAPPNTAQFRVLDDKGNVIIDEQWGLATGYRARLIVVKN